MITVNSTLSYERQTVPPIIPAVQGDTGRTISFKIVDATIPEGATATFYIQKPSGNAVYNTAEIISSNQVLVPLDAQCLAEVGENFGQVRILLDDEVITSFDFILLVKVFHGVDAIESLSEMNVFDQAVADAAADFQTEAEQIAAEVIESIPEDYTELSNDVTNLKQDLEGLDVYTLGLYPQMSVADTAVASITDGADDIPVKSLTVDVDPVQDLHGQANPYPAGGGKNLLPMTLSYVKTINADFTWNGNVGTKSGATVTLETLDGVSVSGIKISGTPTSTLYFRVGVMDLKSGVTYRLTGCPSTPPASDVLYVSGQPSGFGNWVDSGSGANYTPATDYSGIPFYIRIWENTNQNNSMWYPMVRLASISDATFAPYSNICPISGWTGANVKVSDFNQFDGEWVVDTGYNVAKNYMPVIPGETYYIYAPNIPSGERVYANTYDSNKTLVGSSVSIGRVGAYVIPDNVYYMKLRCWGAFDYTNLCFNISDPAKNGTYEPYKGNVYPITFPSSAGTVYGGTLDVTNGVLTVTNGYVDLGTLNWSKNGNYGQFVISEFGNAKPPVNNATVANIISSQYTPDTNENTYARVKDYTISIAADTYMRVYDSRYSSSTGSEFKTAMSGVQLVYELATPVTYQLTPTEVATLLRNNNIFADTGNINELTYRADLKAYIDEKLS